MGTTTCDRCGARWSGPAARWCGECGQALAGRSSTADARTRRDAVGSRRRAGWWAGGVGAVLVLVGVSTWIAVAGGSFGELSEARPDTDVELPDADALEDQTPADDGGSSEGSSEREPTDEAGDVELSCEPEGCERWRLDGFDLRRMHVDGPLLVHTEQGVITTFDPDTGQLRYEVELSQPEGGSLPSASRVTYVDDDWLVVAHDDLITVLDADDGEVLWEIEVEDMPVGLARHGDRLLVRTVAFEAVEEGRPPEHIIVVDDGGAVRWRQQVDHVVRWSDTDGHVLALIDDELHDLDVDGDGSSTWQRPFDPDTSHVHPDDDRILIAEPPRDEVTLIDRRTGDDLQTVSVPSLEHARPLADWVEVTADEQVRIIDPDRGEEVAARSQGEPNWGSASAVALDGDTGQRVVVAWPYPGEGGGQDLLQVYRPDGSLESTIDLPLRATVAVGEPTLLYLHALDDQRVRVVAGHGRDIVVVDIPTGEIVDAHSRPVDDTDGVLHIDGVVVTSMPGRLGLDGPEGDITVEGQDPQLRGIGGLLVSDGNHLLRLDETLLQGEPTPDR